MDRGAVATREQREPAVGEGEAARPAREEAGLPAGARDSLNNSHSE